MPRRALVVVLCALAACGDRSEPAGAEDFDAVPIGVPKMECGSDLVSSGVYDLAYPDPPGWPFEQALRELLMDNDRLASLAADVPARLTAGDPTSRFRLAGRAEGPDQIVYVSLHHDERIIGLFGLTQLDDGRWIGTSSGFCYETVERLAVDSAQRG